MIQAATNPQLVMTPMDVFGLSGHFQGTGFSVRRFSAIRQWIRSRFRHLSIVGYADAFRLSLFLLVLHLLPHLHSNDVASLRHSSKPVFIGDFTLQVAFDVTLGT